MVNNLNLHEWTKVHVYIPVMNAHSAIINRRRIGEKAIEENHDVTRYLVDEVFIFDEENITKKRRKLDKQQG